jgi:hypothetical protein
MHEDDLKNSIFTSIFDDEDTYRKHYVPLVFHIRKNPKKTERIKELVDNATMKYCKKNNIEYSKIADDIKKSIEIDLYNEMIDDEDIRNNRK